MGADNDDLDLVCGLMIKQLDCLMEIWRAGNGYGPTYTYHVTTTSTTPTDINPSSEAPAPAAP